MHKHNKNKKKYNIIYNTNSEICIMSSVDVDLKQLTRSLHPDVLSVVRSHDERSHSGVHGSELSSRERALMMLKSLEENEGNEEDLKFARNKLKQIDSEWVDSLNENDQSDCEEFKQFKRPLESSGLRPSEMHGMLIRKQLTIVMRNIEKLKLLMSKYKDDPGLVGIIRHKLGSIIGEYYGKGAWFEFHKGAHPEYIMNSFIYNPKPVLRIDGNQVTYQPHRKGNPVIEPVKIGLDEFVKLPIGEVYGFFPDPGFDTTVKSYNAKVNNYLKQLMETFAKKPAGFFSTPYVPPAKAKLSSGGSRTHHKRDSKKKKRTCKRRT